MKTVWFYLSACLKLRPISWIEAQRRAGNVSLLNILLEGVDRVMTRIVAAIMSYKLFLRVDIGTRVKQTIEKIHKWMTGNIIGRYILRVLTAETNLHNIAKPAAP